MDNIITNKEILIISIVFFDYEIVKNHIDFIVTIKDRADIVIIENKSDASPLIKEMCLDYLKSKDILQYYLFDENIWGYAILTFLHKTEFDLTKYKYILLTDGDLICKDPNWLDEQLNVINKYEDVFCCAADLLADNLPVKTFPEAVGWIPYSIETNEEFIDCVTGVHLVLFRSQQFIDMINYLNDNNIRWADITMHSYCANIIKKRWAKTKYSKAYHLTWDAYADLNHPYTITKKEIYYHQELVNKWCGYKLYTLDIENNIVEKEVAK